MVTILVTILYDLLDTQYGVHLRLVDMVQRIRCFRSNESIKISLYLKGGFHDFYRILYLVLNTTLEGIVFIPGNEKILKIF